MVGCVVVAAAKLWAWAEVLGRESVRELQCPDPSQLLSSFPGNSPWYSRVRDSPPGWHKAAAGTAQPGSCSSVRALCSPLLSLGAVAALARLQEGHL